MLLNKYTISKWFFISLLISLVAIGVPTAEAKPLGANFNANDFATLNTAIQSANAAAGPIPLP